MKITLKTLRTLKENDGLTLKDYQSIVYKSGWQVATDGVECHTLQEAMKAICQYNGTCGVWLEKGIYYIDKSHRVNTKREAMVRGKACHQISVLCWRNMKLAYCEEY